MKMLVFFLTHEFRENTNIGALSALGISEPPGIHQSSKTAQKSVGICWNFNLISDIYVLRGLQQFEKCPWKHHHFRTSLFFFFSFYKNCSWFCTDRRASRGEMTLTHAPMRPASEVSARPDLSPPGHPVSAPGSAVGLPPS